MEDEEKLTINPSSGELMTTKPAPQKTLEGIIWSEEKDTRNNKATGKNKLCLTKSEQRGQEDTNHCTVSKHGRANTCHYANGYNPQSGHWVAEQIKGRGVVLTFNLLACLEGCLGLPWPGWCGKGAQCGHHCMKVEKHCMHASVHAFVSLCFWPWKDLIRCFKFLPP